MPDFVPAEESKLVPFTNNFAEQLTAHAVAVGLTSGDATSFAALNTAWVESYATATAPSTRTKEAITAKRLAKKACVSALRVLSKRIQSFPGTTDMLRDAFGLPIYKTRTPIGVPEEIPTAEVVERVGTKVVLQLHAPDGKRTLPKGVDGMRVYSFVGETPPDTVTGWFEEGQITTSRVELNFDASLPPGTKVWISAAYYNPRGQLGEGCSPVSTFLAGGSMALQQQQASGNSSTLKAA